MTKAVLLYQHTNTSQATAGCPAARLRTGGRRSPSTPYPVSFAGGGESFRGGVEIRGAWSVSAFAHDQFTGSPRDADEHGLNARDEMSVNALPSKKMMTVLGNEQSDTTDE